MYEQNYDPGLFAAGFGAMFWLFMIGAWLLFAYLQYRMADKCGCKQNAWWAFIPIMNALLLCEMAGKPYWWFILFLVPIVNIVVNFIVWYNVAIRAGHPGFWGILAALPFVNIIAWFYLAFAAGSSQYQRVSPSYSNQDKQRQQTPSNFNQ